MPFLANELRRGFRCHFCQIELYQVTLSSRVLLMDYFNISKLSLFFFQIKWAVNDFYYFFWWINHILQKYQQIKKNLYNDYYFTQSSIVQTTMQIFSHLLWSILQTPIDFNMETFYGKKIKIFSTPITTRTLTPF